MKKRLLGSYALPLVVALTACGAGSGFDGENVAGEGAENGAGSGAEPVQGEPSEVGSTSQKFVSTGLPRLLLIKSQLNAQTPYTIHNDFWEQRFWSGGGASMDSYFRTQSNNRMGLGRAGIVTVRDDFREGDAFAGITAGMNPGIAQRRRAIYRASLAINFRAYDTNQNGTVDSDELPLVIMDSTTGNGGMVRDVGEGGGGCVQIPGGPGPLQYCGGVAHVGQEASFMLMAHEIAHVLFDAADLYGRWGTSDNYNWFFTLQGGSPGGRNDPFRVILDPYHRRRNNWLSAIVNGTPAAEGSARLQPAGGYSASRAGHELVAIARNANEDLLIEYRRKDSANDFSLAEEGIIFWNVRKGGVHGLAEVPSPEGTGAFQAATVLGFTDCRANASRRESIGRGPMAQPNGTYRVSWGDGSDSGLLFTIGAVQGDKSVTIAWRPASTAPTCPVRADYRVSSISEPPPLSHSFGTLTISDGVENVGAPQLAASTVSYYLSQDRTFNSGDVLVGTRSVPALTRIGPVGDPGNAPVNQSWGSLTFTVPFGPPTGDYYYLACANRPQSFTETNTSNNCTASFNTVFIF